MEAPGVIRAKAGIQSFQAFLDPGFRQGDGVDNPISIKLMVLTVKYQQINFNSH